MRHAPRRVTSSSQPSCVHSRGAPAKPAHAPCQAVPGPQRWLAPTDSPCDGRAPRLQILHHARTGRHLLYFHLDTTDFEVPALGMAVSSGGIAGAARPAGS